MSGCRSVNPKSVLSAKIVCPITASFASFTESLEMFEGVGKVRNLITTLSIAASVWDGCGVCVGVLTNEASCNPDVCIFGACV